MAPWAYCTQSAGPRHRVHDPRPEIQPYLRVTSLRCPNNASLMVGWHPEGSDPLAPPSCGVYPAVPTCIRPAQLVGRCLGTVLAGGPKLAQKKPENRSPRWARHALPSSGSVTHCPSGYWWGCPGGGLPPSFVVSNPSLAVCLAVVLAVYLVPSFLVAPLAQICAPVALSPVLPSSATSCAASELGNAMWIPTQHPAQCDSTVPLVIGCGAPFHSVTWHSHGTIAGTCAGGGGGRQGYGVLIYPSQLHVHGTQSMAPMRH